MTDLPAPLTPPDCDLQDFPFMPLHVARLRDSDLAAEAHPEACWYAVLLWAAAWHQLPAGSLPENDAVLARLCGLGRDLRTFRKHKADSMRGFVLCSDGRLYHPVVAEQVVVAWESKRQQRWRTECGRIKKANQRNGTEHPIPTFEQFVAGDMPVQVSDVSLGTEPNVLGDIASKGKRQGQGQGQGQGYIKEDVDERAGAIVDPVETEEFPSDLISLTAEVCRAAGIRHLDPGPVIRHQALVKGWIDEGFDPRSDILAGVMQGVTEATERIGSLQYFDRSIRQFHARKEANSNGHSTRNNGNGPSNPMVRAFGARRSRRAAQGGNDDGLCLSGDG